MSEERGGRLGSFLLGGILGGLAGLAAGKMRSQGGSERARRPPGLSAFEEAPCYRESLALERRETDRGGQEQ